MAPEYCQFRKCVKVIICSHSGRYEVDIWHKSPIKCFNFSREFLTSGSGSGVRLSSSPTSSPSSTSISSTGVLITLTRILSLLSFPISYLLLFVQPLDMLFRGSKTILINRSLNPRSAFKTRKWILHLNLASVQLHEGETYSFCSCKHFGFVCNYKRGLGGAFLLSRVKLRLQLFPQ